MPYKPPRSEPIAVVASSCRFAGGATSPSKLWDLLRQPPDLSLSVPDSRFNAAAFYHPDGDYHGTTDAPRAYWLDDEAGPRAFDAAFFGIAPKEAEAVDPQQRLLLETVYEALESAGYQMAEWSGRDVAVYVGAMTADFDTIAQRDDLTTSPYYATGNARSILANRISYFYDFRGPSATVDTACSSSLVALHHAVLSLRAGDCSAACVAGVNLMLAPEQFVVESSLHMLSPTGHCRMWDARADGYARGEGAAVLLLKPLSRALADGDGPRIQALIRETGVGSDGRTAGITMPSPEAQASLIRSTYRRAGLDLSDPADRCQYFEAHGTGTPVGDPREARAIYSAFFGGEPPLLYAGEGVTASADTTESPLLVGSIKTVVGHTEGAAGLAGILKVILAMQNGKVPPNLHLSALSPEVAGFCTPSPRGSLQVPSALTAWPPVPAGQPLRASVNSFGFGGTNAHAIVERYDASIHGPHMASDRANAAAAAHGQLPHIPLLLSASSASTLRVLATKYVAFLQQLEASQTDMSLEEVAWRTCLFRTPLPHRLALCATSTAEAISMLLACLSGDPQGRRPSADFGSRARRTQSRAPRLLGVFTGQGAQWPGMSRHLLRTSRTYRNTIRHLDAVLRTCPDPPSWTLEQELEKQEQGVSRSGQADISQPLCTALQIGLVILLRSLGVQFACVVGHSSGEIAAAFAADRLSSRDAILIAYYRGRSVVAHAASAPGQEGSMLAVGLSYADASIFCHDTFKGRLCAAASNSPSGATLSGDSSAVDEAEAIFKTRGVFARRLRVDKAYHSHHMAPAADAYRRALEACALAPLASSHETAAPVWISSVDPHSHGAASTTTGLSGQYWVDNLVKPVLFCEAVEAALSHFPGGFDCAVEIGPHCALKSPVLETYGHSRPPSVGTHDCLPYTSLLQRGVQDDVAFSQFLGFMWFQFDPLPVNIRGLLHEADRDALLARHAHLCQTGTASQLPPYPWDHTQTHYRESRLARQFHHRADPPHELLGSRTRDDVDGSELRWRNLLRPDKLPWLAQHAFQGQPLLPASAYCIMARDAAKALLASPTGDGRSVSVIELHNVEFISGIPLDAGGRATEVMVSLVVQRRPKPGSGENEAAIDAVFAIYSGAETAEQPMRQRCTGQLRIVFGASGSSGLPPRMDADEQPEMSDVSPVAFYDMMAELGLDYSGPFAALETMKRRHGFSSATLKRVHAEDTTRLSLSPATLDACLQTCFATYASPGDKSLWTAFLPVRMKQVSFSMAHRPTESPRLAVDACLTDVQPATHGSPARMTGDVLVYGEDGHAEVQIEGLTVGSLASAGPDDDRELFLHTRYRLDPEYAMVPASAPGDDDGPLGIACGRVLEESCERVLAFYDHTQAAADTGRPTPSAWPHDTEEALEQHILSSPFYMTLEKVRTAARGAPRIADTTQNGRDHLLWSIVEEGHHFSQFQNQVARVVQQIAHRYPRMSVFSLTDAEKCLSVPILKGLGTAFAGYTSTLVGQDKSLAFQLAHAPRATVQKVRFVSVDSDDAIKACLAGETPSTEQKPFDLAIVSTSIFQQLASSGAVLGQVRRLMRPGGFLVLVHVPTQRLRTAGPAQSSTGFPHAIITPPDWPDLLDQHGFMNPGVKNTDQNYPGGFAITVRQSESSLKRGVAAALAAEPWPSKHRSESLLIVGGRTPATRALAAHISQLLAPSISGTITAVPGLDDLAEAEHAAAVMAFTSVILLADLDDGCSPLTTLSDQRLAVLRRLLVRPEMTMLWVTKGARVGNAECAASYGFTRSIRGEMPSLVLQMLDFDKLVVTTDGQLCGAGQGAAVDPSPSAATVIADAWSALLQGARHQRDTSILARERHNRDGTHQDNGDDHLWVLEPEVFMDSTGNRLVPRVVPYMPGNDRFAASRRVVTQQVNTLSTCVVISPCPATGSRYVTHVNPSLSPPVYKQASAAAAGSDSCLVQVHYSTHLPYYEGRFLCVGRDEKTGNTVACLSNTNASFVAVPRASCTAVSAAGNVTAAYAHVLARALLCSRLLRAHSARQLILVAQDDALLRACLGQLSSGRHADAVLIYVTDAGQDPAAAGSRALHPRATAAQVRAVLGPVRPGAVIVDLMPTGHRISAAVSAAASPSASCVRHFWQGAAKPSCGSSADVFDSLCEAVRVTNEALASILHPSSVPDAISVPALVDGHGKQDDAGTIQIVDWRADRTVSHRIAPLLASDCPASDSVQLRADRTYVLVGITRDMGQSLSTLLVKHGARHIVLASRNPPAQQPRWARCLGATHGAQVRLDVLDVTDLGAVRQFRGRVEQAMPRIGGLVNGAMLLDDRVFAHMTADTFSRVMRPKTVGSRNLDLVFRDDDDDADSKLDFFIMTSSFAAVGGHAGQSNYAAANMFMNGVAADRQRRGVAGSVMNIGVVYGLGFLHREKGALYAGLEREGYPPISERDLHHMVLEAIRLGRPKTSAQERNRPIVDLTTGLSRFDPRQAADAALSWHTDPRFSHYSTLDAGGSGHGHDGTEDAKPSAGVSSAQQLADAVAPGTATADELAPLLAAAFAERLAALLRLETPADGSSCSLAELGVDSLVAVEMRTWLWRTTGRDVAVMWILGAATIDRLCLDIARAMVADRG